LLAGNFTHGTTLNNTAGGWADGSGRAAKLYGYTGAFVSAGNELVMALKTAATNYTTTDALNQDLANSMDQWVQHLAGELPLTPGAYNPGTGK
jgi:hypothetical protein